MLPPQIENMVDEFEDEYIHKRASGIKRKETSKKKMDLKYAKQTKPTPHSPLYQLKKYVLSEVSMLTNSNFSKSTDQSTQEHDDNQSSITHGADAPAIPDFYDADCNVYIEGAPRYDMTINTANIYISSNYGVFI